MMKVKVMLGGGTQGTRVFNAETGEELRNLQSMTLRHYVGELPTVELVM